MVATRINCTCAASISRFVQRRSYRATLNARRDDPLVLQCSRRDTQRSTRDKEDRKSAQVSEVKFVESMRKLLPTAPPATSATSGPHNYFCAISKLLRFSSSQSLNTGQQQGLFSYSIDSLVYSCELRRTSFISLQDRKKNA